MTFSQQPYPLRASAWIQTFLNKVFSSLRKSIAPEVAEQDRSKQRNPISGIVLFFKKDASTHEHEALLNMSHESFKIDDSSSIVAL